MTIPPSALPVVLLLREHVPRPATLPRYIKGVGLRWGDPRHPELCPVLMLPGAISKNVSGLDFWNFVEWWDGRRKPEPAVNAIWGKA